MAPLFSRYHAADVRPRDPSRRQMGRSGDAGRRAPGPQPLAFRAGRLAGRVPAAMRPGARTSPVAGSRATSDGGAWGKPIVASDATPAWAAMPSPAIAGGRASARLFTGRTMQAGTPGDYRSVHFTSWVARYASTASLRVA